jgi:flagellin
MASEMSRFTSKQILVQAGVAMLAQANQQPQALLRLLQQ